MFGSQLTHCNLQVWQEIFPDSRRPSTLAPARSLPMVKVADIGRRS